MSNETMTKDQVDREVPLSSSGVPKEGRAQQQAATRTGGGEWLFGLLLIGIGSAYLLHDAGYLPTINNWWALFMLLPGIGLFSAAIGAYRNNGGEWSAEVILPLTGGLLFVGATAILVFELSFGLYLPLFLIAAGLLLVAVPVLKGR